MKLSEISNSSAKQPALLDNINTSLFSIYSPCLFQITINDSRCYINLNGTPSQNRTLLSQWAHENVPFFSSIVLNAKNRTPSFQWAHNNVPFLFFKKRTIKKNPFITFTIIKYLMTILDNILQK